MSKHILISRTDNLGDFVLTLPMAYELKRHIKDCKVSFLAKAYLKPIAQAYSYIDSFYPYEELLSLRSRAKQIEFLKKQKIDTVIHVYPRFELAKLFYEAGIKERVGTNRRLFHWLFCNKRVNLSRNKTDLHESQLNLKLLEPLVVNSIDASWASLKENLIIFSRDKTKFQDLIRKDRFNLIIHPGSKGSSRHWTIDKFIGLIKTLDKDKFKVFVTGQEEEKAQYRDPILASCPFVVDLFAQCNLQELVDFVSACDGFVAGSTGPVHIAGALGVYTLGLYPNTKGINQQRWGVVGKRAQSISSSAVCLNCKRADHCTCMKNLQVDAVVSVVQQWYQDKFRAF